MCFCTQRSGKGHVYLQHRSTNKIFDVDPSHPFPTRQCASEHDLSRALPAQYLKAPFLLRKTHLSVNCVWCVLKWKQHLESLRLIAEIYHKMNKCNRWWLVLYPACGAWIFIQTSGCWAVNKEWEKCKAHWSLQPALSISVLLRRLRPGSSSAVFACYFIVHGCSKWLIWTSTSKYLPLFPWQLYAVYRFWKFLWSITFT